MTGEYAKVNPNVARVVYMPSAQRVNGMIAYLNDKVGEIPAKDSAEFMASVIAAVAYMMLETNDVETTKTIFNALVDEAYNQRRETAESNSDRH